MYPNHTRAFLSLEGVLVKKVVRADSLARVPIRSQSVEQACPRCGVKTERIRDYCLQEVRDTPLLRKQVILLLHRHHYFHPYCRRRFTGPYSLLPSYHHRAHKLTLYIVFLLRQTFSLGQIVELTDVSAQMVCRLLDTVCYPPPDQLSQTLSINEFEGDASTGRYRCILVDPKKRRILDILPDQTQSHLADYWRNIPREGRLKVELFVCDIWHPYIGLVQTFFPNAIIIVDKYHFIRQMTWVTKNVRKWLQRSMPASLRKYCKGNRKLILTRYRELKDEGKQACDLMLHYSEDLYLTHRTKG